ncbi:DNA polymerase I, partial [bacterium]|nr:DNA polymerase I [bacterium]
AAQIFNIHEQFVTPEQRSIGKRINFSIIYGQTAFGLSKALKIKLSEAKNYIEAYFTQYSAVRPWMEATEKLARENGFVETLMGRRRYIPGLKEKNKHLYEAARRAAINTVIQGTAAEIIKKSMIELNQIIKEKFPESALLLQIHDELVIECPKEDANQLCEIVGTTMRSAVDWEVKLEISTKIGDNWADVTK